jgi:hypothetical protein
VPVKAAARVTGSCDEEPNFFHPRAISHFAGIERLSDGLNISCDEAGHTGPDLLAKDQRYFAFGSVAVGDAEAFEIIQKARTDHPVQMPELKATTLLRSERGRRLIDAVLVACEGRYAVSVHEKLLALCCWLFEYIYEPVFKHDPWLLYEKNLHRFVAMFTWLWLKDGSSEARAAIVQFQKYTDQTLSTIKRLRAIAVAIKMLGLTRGEIPNWIADRICGFEGEIVWPNDQPFTYADTFVDDACNNDCSFRWISYLVKFADVPPRQRPQRRVISRLRLIDLALRVAARQRERSQLHSAQSFHPDHSTPFLTGDSNIHADNKEGSYP